MPNLFFNPIQPICRIVSSKKSKIYKMKKILSPLFILIAVIFFATGTYAQTENRPDDSRAKQDKEQPVVQNEPIKEAEKSLEKAAESIQRSAEKIKVVVEDRADRIARVSQPAIESFLVASSNLIEQIAKELERMVSEKPVKKSTQ